MSYLNISVFYFFPFFYSLLTLISFLFFIIADCFNVSLTILATPYPWYSSASSIRARFVNRRHFLLSRCPPSAFFFFSLSILPRLFGRPDRPVTSRPRSRVNKLRNAMSVYFMRGIISSEGNHITARQREYSYHTRHVYRDSALLIHISRIHIYYFADFCLRSRPNMQICYLKFSYVE